MKKTKMRTRIGARVTAGTQHFDNITGLPAEPDTSKVIVTNGWSEGLLVAPEEDDEGVVGGNTHTSNLTASARPNRRRRVQADAAQVLTINPVPGNDIATLPPETDPAKSYLETGGKDTVDNAQNVAPLIANLDDEDDEDDEDDWDLQASLPSSGEDEDDGDSEDDEDEDDESITANADPDAIDLIDVKDCDDTVRNLAFVMQANRLLALKDHMVVAMITPKSAASVNLQATYTKPQFQTALIAEAKRIGLRAALQGNGFQPVRVNLTASKLVAKRIETERQRIEASVQRTVQASRSSFDQSLAIATVGIHRGFFNSNSRLIAALENELIGMGISKPGAIVKKVFAQHGPQFIKAHFDMAAQLSDMPQEMRDQYVKSLDLINGDGTQDDTAPIDPQQVTAAFTSPATRVSASQDAGLNRRDRNRLNASVVAQQILTGSKPLF